MNIKYITYFVHVQKLCSILYLYCHSYFILSSYFDISIIVDIFIIIPLIGKEFFLRITVNILAPKYFNFTKQILLPNSLFSTEIILINSWTDQ